VSAAGEPPIKVLLVEDHAVVRQGLRLVLETMDHIVVAGEAGDADEATRRAASLRPDVIVLDITMPGRSGIEALPDLLAVAPGSRVLILSMQDDPAYVRRAFNAGAHGYVLKDVSDTELIDAIHEVAAGRQYVHPALGARLAAAEAQRRVVDEELSDREREVARLLALGYTNQEIAKLLYVSVRTAEAHRAHIMRKLRLATRAELVRWAFEHGLVDPES
jgi:DNA-binding NarL/FixJ family response regulator